MDVLPAWHMRVKPWPTVAHLRSLDTMSDADTSKTTHHTAPDGSEVTEHVEHHESDSGSVKETALDVESGDTVDSGSAADEG
jgi:hypothetical protein